MWDIYVLEVEESFVKMGPYLWPVRKVRKIDIKTPYQKAVCYFFTKLGDFLSANRRASWPGDRIWARWFWGFYFYQKLRDLVLFGKFQKARRRWNPKVKGNCKDRVYYF